MLKAVVSDPAEGADRQVSCPASGRETFGRDAWQGRETLPQQAPAASGMDQTSPFHSSGRKKLASTLGSRKCWHGVGCSGGCSRKSAYSEQNRHKLLGLAQAACETARRK